MKELLLNSIVSKAREFTTFSMNTGSDFDPWNLKSADFFVYSLLVLRPRLVRIQSLVRKLPNLTSRQDYQAHLLGKLHNQTS